MIFTTAVSGRPNNVCCNVNVDYFIEFWFLTKIAKSCVSNVLLFVIVVCCTLFYVPFENF